MTHFRPLLIAAFAALLLLSPTPIRAQDESLASVTAQQYIVVDAETGEVFAEKLGDGRAGMASVTKLFTLMEAVQRAPLDSEVTVLESDMFGSDSTKMTGFFPGARFTLEDLLYGMMLESGNDAAYAIARAVGAQPGDTEAESVARFVGWMNERAISLGLRNTQLRNPHGLSEEGHFTTPRDLSAFLMYGLGVEPFVRVMVARSFVTSTGVEIFSINRAPEFIPDQIGGKTGYDNATGYCLAEVAERNGRRMIAVTFDGLAPDIWYVDQAILFDYAYTALEERVASNEPIGVDRVAFLAPGSRAAQIATAEQAPRTEATPVFAGVDAVQEPTVPTPVRVDSLPQPPVVASNDRSITGNWIVPVSVLVGLLGLMALRPLVRHDARLPRAANVDTPGPAS